MSLLSFCCLLALLGAAAAQPLPQLPCGGTVTNVALAVDNRVPGALANVVISFSTQTALAPYNTVTLSYPPNFFVPPTNPATAPAISINQALPGVTCLGQTCIHLRAHFLTLRHFLQANSSPAAPPFSHH
jgi:hypothetical protein